MAKANAAPIYIAHGRKEQFGRWRDVVTPEGATIRLRVADAGERASALLIDLAIMLAALIVLSLVIGYGAASIGGTGGGATAFILINFLFFFLRAFYFTWFEMGRKAATPGKRVMKLRVVAQNGRQLTANSVFARNVMRELELFLPMAALFSGPGTEQYTAILSLLFITWAGLFLLLPFFNKDRLRAGDMVAGTWVISLPKPDLEQDLTLTKSDTDGLYRFTPEQLAAYGEHELHVLENVLRQSKRATMKAVADRIRGKIEWQSTAIETDRGFLDAYYKGLRKTLEARLLMGDRKVDKYDDITST